MNENKGEDMGLLDIAVSVAKVGIPPKSNDLDAQQRWRWFVFTSIIGLATALTVHILLACGFLPSVYPGFALTADTQQIQKRVDVIATLSLEHEIRSKASDLCKEKDPSKRSSLNDDIAKLEKEYYDIARNWYPIPNCEQL
jgi:hypothetical protein